MNDDIHSLVGAYAVDAVDDAERARFEEHLATCAGCRAEVESLRGAAAHLAASTDTAPPASLKASLLRDIRSVRPLPPVVDEQDGLPGDDGQVVARQDPAPAADPTPAPTAAVADLQTRREQKTARRHPVARWVATAAAAAAVVVGGVVWQPWDNGPSRPPVAASAQQQVLRAGDARGLALPAQLNVTRATGTLVGELEPPAGSTVIPAPMAVAASPSSSTPSLARLTSGISPAFTMCPSGRCSQTS